MSGSNRKRKDGSQPGSSSKRQRAATRDLQHEPNVPRKESIQAHRLKSNRYDKKSKSLQEAYFAVIRIMWGLKGPQDVPTLPPSDVLAEFNRRYSEPGYNPVMSDGAASLSLSQQKYIQDLHALRAVPASTSRATNNILKLEDKVLSDMMRACTSNGLLAWRPDFRASPDSPYNSVHRDIAETIFIQLASRHAFAHMGVDLKYMKNEHFLRRTFNHFVFHVTRGNWQRVLLNPTALEDAAKDNTETQRRCRLRDERYENLEQSNAPRRHTRLVEDAAAHSDDEVVDLDVSVQVTASTSSAIPPGAVQTTKKTVLLARTKPLRSAKVTRWLQHIDNEIDLRKSLMHNRTKRTAKKYERVHDSIRAPPSRIPKLPPKVPIDYFDPDQFNALPTPIRRQWSHKPRVAFPLDETLMYQTPPHESMSMKEGPFMEKYGNDVLALYRIPKEGDPDSDDPDAWSTDDGDEE